MTGPIGPPLLEVHLPVDPSAPGRAREALRVLEPRLPPAVFANLRLLVTEVVTNSVRHAGMSPGDEVLLSVHLHPGRVRVEVGDAGPGFTPRRGLHGTHDPETGWGLYLVDLLAHRWGSEAGAGCRTWFEFEVTSSPP